METFLQFGQLSLLYNHCIVFYYCFIFPKLLMIVAIHRNLGNNTLSGELPDSWSALTSLSTLCAFYSIPTQRPLYNPFFYRYLHSNRITGDLPDSWSSLTNLITLCASFISLLFYTCSELPQILARKSFEWAPSYPVVQSHSIRNLVRFHFFFLFEFKF